MSSGLDHGGESGVPQETTRVQPEPLPSCNRGATTRGQGRATTWLASEEEGSRSKDCGQLLKAGKARGFPGNSRKGCHGLTEHVSWTSDPS